MDKFRSIIPCIVITPGIVFVMPFHLTETCHSVDTICMKNMLHSTYHKTFCSKHELAFLLYLPTMQDPTFNVVEFDALKMSCHAAIEKQNNYCV